MIYEIINIGKGAIESINPDNLLLIKEDQTNNSIDPNLQAVIDSGNYAEIDLGETFISLLKGDGAGKYSEIFHSNEGNGSDFFIDKDQIYLNSFTDYISASFSMINGIMNLEERINGSQQTNVGFSTPLSSTELKFPSKTVSGTYNLATSVNGIEADSEGNIVVAVGSPNLQAVLDTGTNATISGSYANLLRFNKGEVRTELGMVNGDKESSFIVGSVISAEVKDTLTGTGTQIAIDETRFVVNQSSGANATSLKMNIATVDSSVSIPAPSTFGVYTLPLFINGASADDQGVLTLPNESPLQKVIVYPTDFISGNYTITDNDNNHEIIIDNSNNPVTITVPSGLTSKIGIGFTQKGSSDVSYLELGTTIRNPIGLKIKGQYYQTYLSQEGSTNVFYLGGNTKI